MCDHCVKCVWIGGRIIRVLIGFYHAVLAGGVVTASTYTHTPIIYKHTAYTTQQSRFCVGYMLIKNGYYVLSFAR
jgi:hypothetical protein